MYYLITRSVAKESKLVKASMRSHNIVIHIKELQAQPENAIEGFCLEITKTEIIEEYPASLGMALQGTHLGLVFYRGGVWRTQLVDEGLKTLADEVGGIGLEGSEHSIPWH